MNRIFFIAAIPFLLMALALAGSTALFRFTSCYLALLIIGAFIIAAMSIRSKLPLLLYATGVLAGVLCVLAIALWGFYDPNVTILNSTTSKPDKSFGDAITDAFLGLEAFTASRLFACDTATGPACTRFQDSLGTGLDYTMLIGGTVAGAALARRRLKSVCKESI